MKARALPLLLAILLSFSFHAADLAVPNVLIPIAGRALGSFGSQWQTDLVVTNLQPEPVPLVLTFYGTGGEFVFTTTTLAAGGTMVLDDVVYKTFGLSPALGMIRVSSAREGARVTARATISDRGNASGEYGQGVPGIPVDALTTEHVLSGITASGGRRTNIGVANPWTVPASIILTLNGSEGEELGRLYRIVPALEVLQINDAFGAFGVPAAEAASVRVTSQVGVYAYASIVSNDSGDAVFVTGTGVGVRTSSAIAPRCAEPASLGTAKPGQQAAEGWIVVMKPETSINYIANVLPAQHGYTVASLYEAIPGFAAELTPQQIAALRCEAAVLFIEQNVVVEVGDGTNGTDGTDGTNG